MLIAVQTESAKIGLYVLRGQRQAGIKDVLELEWRIGLQVFSSKVSFLVARSQDSRVPGELPDLLDFSRINLQSALVVPARREWNESGDRSILLPDHECPLGRIRDGKGVAQSAAEDQR